MFFRSFFRDVDPTPPPAAPADPPTPADPPAPEVDNAAVKAHPLFQKMAKDILDLTKRETDREAAETAKAEEAEQKRLKDAGLFDEAAAKHKAALEAKDAAHAAELQTRDIEAALLQANFRNGTFIKGAVATYNAESDGTIAEYVAALVADESNAAFISTTADPPPKEPGKVVVDGATRTNWEEVKAWEKSKKREERMKARKLLGEYHDKNGKYPYERT